MGLRVVERLVVWDANKKTLYIHRLSSLLRGPVVNVIELFWRKSRK